MNQDLEASATALGVREVFAYPMGLSNPNIKQSLLETGFTLAVTQQSGYATPDSDPLLLPRFLISSERYAQNIIDEILQNQFNDQLP
jgi:hypothetical protein